MCFRAVLNLQKSYDELKTLKQKVETLESKKRDLELKYVQLTAYKS